jgi:predicted ArsR family transcriptional regulator
MLSVKLAQEFGYKEELKILILFSEWTNLKMPKIFTEKNDKIIEDIAKMRLNQYAIYQPQKFIIKTNNKEFEISNFDNIDKNSFDFIIDSINLKIFEKSKDTFDFKDKNILFNILRFLVENASHAYTKEELIKHVWLENYNPLIHDTIVYTAISRLRTIIEKNQALPKYIKNNDGKYYFDNACNFLYIADKFQYKTQLNSRQSWLMHYLKYNEKITLEDLIKNIKASKRTAFRDINELTEQGLLAKKKIQDRMYYILT